MSARPALVIAAILATIGVNGLANALPLNGQQTGAISNRFDVLFVPAGYVFSIWGLIYLALLAYGAYQALPSTREDPRVRSVDGLVIGSCVFNGAWIFAWHYEQFALSLVLMLALLASLIGIYLRLDIGRTRPEGAQRWLLDLPFSIYLGWITVATIANASTVLVYYEWGGWGLSDINWFFVMLCAAQAIAAAMAWTRADAAYLAVLVWAFAGIAVRHASDVAVMYAALGAAMGTAGLLIWALLRRRARSASASGTPS